MTVLGEWLQGRLRKPREAGVWDCCTLPGDWTVDQGLPDPMAKWRGAYSTEEEAAVFIEDAGGLLPLFEEGFAQAGVPKRSSAPGPGDVGVLRIGDLEAGAIYVGPRWCFVATRGLGFASIDQDCIAAVWAVSHG